MFSSNGNKVMERKTLMAQGREDKFLEKCLWIGKRGQDLVDKWKLGFDASRDSLSIKVAEGKAGIEAIVGQEGRILQKFSSDCFYFLNNNKGYPMLLPYYRRYSKFEKKGRRNYPEGLESEYSRKNVLWFLGETMKLLIMKLKRDQSVF